MLLILGMFACGEPEPEPACEEWRPLANVDGVIDNDEDCGQWTLPIGEHLYVNVYVSEELSPCEAEHAAEIGLPYDPIYTNLETDGPKWTFDFVGNEVVSDSAIDVSCDDGTEWHARVSVEE